MKIIARIRSDYKEKFGIPRQSGLVQSARARIVFEEPYRVREAVRGLEEFSHIWILWQFSLAVREDWSPTVRPPLLGGNKRVGVFATRSPFRPNPIGLSAVRLEKIEFTDEGPVLHVGGADLMDGTPIYDIKPYLPYADAHPEAVGGFTENLSERRIPVEIEDERFFALPEARQTEIREILSGDPRPSYKGEGEEHGMHYADWEVKFTVRGGVLYVTEVAEGKPGAATCR